MARSLSSRIQLESLRRLPLLPVCLSVLAFIWYEWISWTQFASLQFYLADIGVNDLVIANTLQGRFMESPIGGWNYFAVHFKPILLLVAPLYLAFNHPMTLATCYNMALAGAAVPLALLARERLAGGAPSVESGEGGALPTAPPAGDATTPACQRAPRWIAPAFAAAWLGNHFVLSLHLSIHPESLAMPFFFLLFLAGAKGRPVLYWVSLLLILANKEDMPVYLFFYGLYLAFAARDRNRRRGLATAGVALAWLLLAAALIGALRPETGAYKGGVPALERYNHLGDDWGEVTVNALAHPIYILKLAITPPSLWILLGLLALLPLVHLRGLWLLLPPAILLLASNYSPQYNLWFYYSYPFLPFAFLLAVEGAATLARRIPRAAPAVAVLLLAGAALSLSQPTRADGLFSRPFRVTNRDAMIRALLRERVPSDARVAAQYELICHVPRARLVVPLWPENYPLVDTLAVDFLSLPPDMRPEEREALGTTVNGGDWKPIAEYDGFVVFRRKELVSPP
jgi:uncharacterized membrane protein